MERLPVFHIGANKAGSTTLQKALFGRHPEVLNLGKPTVHPNMQEALSQILVACDRNTRMPRHDSEATRRLWQQTVAHAPEQCVPLFSKEELIRYQYYGQPDPLRLPKAIVEMVGPLRVVMVIRHQLRLIESLYVHKSNSANFMSPDNWLASHPERFSFAYRYHEIADAWSRIVGEQNVGVFLFEELVRDSEVFATHLCDFVGIDAQVGIKLLSRCHENVRKSKRTQAYARFRSAVLPKASLGKLLARPWRQRWRNYLEGGPRAEVSLPPDWLHRIVEYYRSDNRKLAERFKLPLREYDYPM